jgi:tRNA/tmRNA/rRNA uracil-C5-methylase (TrmA/RlmC/RlmD family)
LPPEIPVVSGSTTGFRLRARLAIRGRIGTPKLGLFELGTHRVVHIPNCSVQHPLINHVAGVVRRALVDAGVSCYSERAGLGLARYLQVVVERSSQSAQVVLVANAATREPLDALFGLVRERLGADLHSLWFTANEGRSNAILGPAFECVCGPPSVVERFGGAAVHYPPGAFGQSNLDGAEALIDALRVELPQGARVAEFYAGVGAIGLSLLDRAAVLRMNEVGEHSLAGLALGVAGLDAGQRAKVCVLPGEAGANHAAADGVDVVIADPPRKGLDLALLEFLSRSPPERLLYVSCGIDALLRDAARLTAAGKLRLRRLTAFNLMPFTEHVETLACFERASSCRPIANTLGDPP